MMNWLAELWNDKRWLFWLLLPLTLLAVGLRYYLDYLEYKADKDLRETEEKDKVLKDKQDEFNKGSEDKKLEADKIEEKIKNRDNNDINDDWHLKK